MTTIDTSTGEITGTTEYKYTTLSGKLAAKYSYDAWGKCVSVENSDGCTIGTANPFRYRGYYYDTPK